MSDGLFSRWAKRKQDVAAENEKVVVPTPDVGPATTTSATDATDASVTPGMANGEAQPLPSIESLTAESDFSPFMARDVAPDMRNQAMKKLFTDPHYNVMDGLDIYIDDYGKPDPLPEGWLQLMNQSKTLRLFETAEEEAARLGIDAAGPQKAAIAATAQSDDAATLDDVALVASEQTPVEQLTAASAPIAPSGSAESRSRDIHVSPGSESKLT